MTRVVGKQSRILVVEDELLLAMLVREELALAGHEVLGPACSHKEAVDFPVSQKPDLVIMDIRLKDSDGVAAAIEIWQRTGVRCVFTSANTDPLTVRRAECLMKPYDLDTVFTAIAAAVAEARG